MKVRWTLFVLIWAIITAASWATRVDGSDPMPLCRPSSGRTCKPTVTTPAVFLADGGPLFLCPPGSKTCKCSVTHCG